MHVQKKKPRTDIKRVHIGSVLFCPDFLIAKGALTDLDMCNVGTRTSCFNGQLNTTYTFSILKRFTNTEVKHFLKFYCLKIMLSN